MQLATELSAATAQLTTIQLEVTNLNKREAELQKQLEMSNSSSSQNKHELSELKKQNTGEDPKLNQLFGASHSQLPKDLSFCSSPWTLRAFGKLIILCYVPNRPKFAQKKQLTNIQFLGPA